jgi:hypothetical protein
MYAIIRGKNPVKGFTKVANKTKLLNGTRPWHGLQEAYDGLFYCYRKGESGLCVKAETVLKFMEVDASPSCKAWVESRIAIIDTVLKDN